MKYSVGCSLRVTLAVLACLILTPCLSDAKPPEGKGYAKNDTGGSGGSGGSGNSGGGGESSGSGVVVGTKDATSPTTIHLTSDFSLSSDITIAGPVVIVADGNFNIGNHTLNVAEGGSLQLYVEGDIKISGTGSFNNTNTSESLQILGTSKTGQSMDVKGNGYLSAMVYAPYADLDVDGGGSSGETMGAFVGKTINYNGTAAQFHFDEALMDLDTNFSSYILRSYDLVYDRSSTMEDETNKPSYEDYIAYYFKKNLGK